MNVRLTKADSVSPSPFVSRPRRRAQIPHRAILIVIFLITAQLVYPSLIDVTPGGISSDPGPPSVGTNNLFFDEARSEPYTIYGPTPVYPPGWVSMFGVLNGGQFFFTDLFANPPGPTAQVSWNFAGSTFWLTYIDVFGSDSNGTFSNLYQVPFGSRFDSNGQDTVTINGRTNIIGISFYGTDSAHAPDGGASVVLLGIGLSGIGLLCRIVTRRQ